MTSANARRLARIPRKPHIAKLTAATILALICVEPAHAAPSSPPRLPISSELGTLGGFWTTEPLPDKWITASKEWLRSSALAFTDSLIEVRLLGGWPQSGGGPENDLAFRDHGILRYRWDLLKARVDTALDAGLKPILVLDNVPYAFVAHPIPNGPYGQLLDPDNPDEYGQFIEALCRELVALYGYDKANTFWFRVGTEPNFTGHRVGTPDLYMRTYDFVAAAVKKVLPSAKIGPGNFVVDTINASFPAEDFVRKIALGPNPATGGQGAPIDFLAISAYGIYRTGTYKPEGWESRYIQKLEALRNVSPTLANVPLQIQEFGMFSNERNQESWEPGVYGAAWTAQAYILGMEHHISRIIHWAGYEEHHLLRGDGWLMTQLMPMIGGNAALILNQTGGDGTAIKGISVTKADATYLVISSFNVDRNVNNRQHIGLDITSTVRPAPDLDVSRAVQYELDASNSVMDVLYQDLVQRHLLKNPNLLIGHPQDIAAAAGEAFITAHLLQYTQLQNSSLDAKPFSGRIYANDSNQIILECEVATPGVKIIKLIVTKH